MRRSTRFLALLLLAAPLAADPLADPSDPAVAAAPQSAPASPALDDEALQNSFYIHADLGAQTFNDSSWRPSNDLLATDTYGGTDSNTAALLEMGLGFQGSDGLGVELGFGVSPIDTLYIMPVYRVATGGLGSRPLMHTFGARAGWSVLGANTSDYDYSDSHGNYATLDNDPGFASYALCYRLEQMLGSRFSLGLELAYHFARATLGTSHEVYDSSTSGYDMVHDAVTFDYSGPSVCISLAVWPARPFWGAADVAQKKEAEARRLARAEARAQRYRLRYATVVEEAPERSYASVDEAVAVGQAALDSEQAPRARTAFQEAVLLDPRSAKAWRGLADAEYALKLRRKALPHYERALALGGPDPSLKAFIAQLRALLDAAPDED